MSKTDQLAAIAEQIVQDDVTPHLRESATQLVIGEGTADAEVVFIGEAPGAEEDARGLPFVGAAGKFLNEMLASIGWDRSDVYITNIVKYRPPLNRDPEPDEIKQFLPYLVKQIEVIRPQIIATLGRFSMSIFLPDARISQIHGQPKRIKIKTGTTAGQGTDITKSIQADKAHDSGELGLSAGESVPVVIMPLYHPAAALYNGSMRETLLADFARLPEILEQIKHKKTQFTPTKQESIS